MKNFFKNLLNGMKSFFNFGYDSELQAKIEEVKNQTTEEAFQKDADAIASDWRAVGEDIDNAIAKLTKELREKDKN